MRKRLLDRYPGPESTHTALPLRRSPPILPPCLCTHAARLGCKEEGEANTFLPAKTPAGGRKGFVLNQIGTFHCSIVVTNLISKLRHACAT